MSDLSKAYNVLGLEPGSDKQAIQARYKRLVLVWHPDRFPTDEGKADAEDELKRINNAKELLVKHFDGGKHKSAGCECGAGSGGSSSSRIDVTAGGASRTSGGGSATSSSARRRSEEVDREAAAPPTAAQKKRWAELEREFEYEMRADEIEAEKAAVEWLFQQRMEEKAAERKRTTRRSKQPTIQDQLDAAKSGGKAAAVQDDKTIEILQNCLEEWKGAVLNPIEYFTRMPLDGGLKEPAMFVAVIAAVNSIAWFLAMMAHPVHAAQFALGAFVVLFGGSFVLAATTQRLSEIMGGDGDYEASYRACAYSFAPNILLWIPIISFFSWLYSLFLFKLAVASAHDLRSVRCNVIVGIQVLVPAVLGIIVWLTGVAKSMSGVLPAMQ